MNDANDSVGKAKKRRKPKPPPMPRPERLRRLGLVTLAGVLTFLSFPFTTERDSNLWPLAWFALVPFLEGIRGLTGKRAFWFGALGGFVTNLGGFWWISEVLREFGHLPWYVYWPLTLLNSFYQGLMFAVFALLVARAARWKEHGLVPVWHVAALFTAVEWLFPMIFPWYLANGQYRFLPAIQIAELGGVMCISFVMVAFNAGLHRLWVHRALRRDPARPELPRRALIATFLGTAIVLIYGQVRVVMVDAQIAEADKLELGLVEADIGIFEKQAKHLPPREQALTLHRNLLKHQTMSAALEARGVDLVVWPESSFFPLDDPFIKRTDRMALGLVDGRLVEWVYDAARDDFAWRALAGAEVESVREARALAVLREDRFVTLGPEGLGEAGTALPEGATFRAIALVAAPGFGTHEDHARATVWAAGERGALAFGRLGQALKPVGSGVSETLDGIAMKSARDGVAVGRRGALVEIEREAARAVAPVSQDDLSAVAWSGPSKAGQVALAVGREGAIAVRFAEGWELERLPGEIDLVAVDFDRDNAPWVGGAGGYVATRVAGAWQPVPLPSARDVTALAVDPLGAVLVADAAGGLWVRPEGASAWRSAATDLGPAGQGSGVMSAIASAEWAQAIPLPRDVRWVRQSRAPLPALVDFDRDPTIELAQASDRDRATVQRGFTTPILFGGLTWAPPPPGKERRVLYNTAIMLDQRGRVVDTYDKVYLLAFGEYMPFGETFPGLYDAFPQAGRFTAGDEVKTFTWRGHRIGIMICYEDIMADFTGRLADLEPNIIINVTNDAWFGKTAEPWLHLALAVFRAVENRLTLVRSTNTGISAFIDPTGRLTGATRMDDAEVLVGEVPLMSGGTVYGAVGNLFASAMLILVVAHASLAWHRRRQRRRPEGETT